MKELVIVNYWCPEDIRVTELLPFYPFPLSECMYSWSKKVKVIHLAMNENHQSNSST